MSSPTGIRIVAQDQEEARWQRRVVRQNFLGYYQRELTYLRKLGAEFKKNHPAVASRLRLDDDQCNDPHVERIIESFAFIAARIHLRIDDEFPEISSAVLDELYPNFTRPVPSFSLVEFRPDPERGKQTAGKKIPRGATLQSNPTDGFVCRFRTCFETELLPLSVSAASWRPGSNIPPRFLTRDTASALEIRLTCAPDVQLGDLDLRNLRFHLSGVNELVFPLYELLLSRCHTIVVQDPTAPAAAPREFKMHGSSLSAGGFGEDESLCRDLRDRRSFSGYHILQDYFSFPEKFLFVDLTGIQELRKKGFTTEINLLFLISPFDRAEWRNVMEQGVEQSTFRLNCTPIVNLFDMASDPITIRPGAFELPIPTKDRTEVFSVNSVYGMVKGGTLPFQRYIDCGHEESVGPYGGAWKSVRRASRTEENVSEVHLSLFGREGEPVQTEAESLTARVTCTNRDWPFRLPMNDRRGDFHMENHPEIRIVCVRNPTKGSPAPADHTSMWRLLSQLSLNHLSLVEEGCEALQCILRIHNLADSPPGEENIAGIRSVSSKPHFARVSSEHGMAFVRGKRVEITLDERRFAGSGAFLFCTVLERFLGLYTSLNSFSQLSLKSDMRGDKVAYVWPPRAGLKVVL